MLCNRKGKHNRYSQLASIKAFFILILPSKDSKYYTNLKFRNEEGARSKDVRILNITRYTSTGEPIEKIKVFCFHHIIVANLDSTVILDSKKLILDGNFRTCSSACQTKPLINASFDTYRQYNNLNGWQKEKVYDRIRDVYLNTKVVESERRKRNISFHFHCSRDVTCYDKKRGVDLCNKGIIKVNNETKSLPQAIIKLLKTHNINATHLHTLIVYCLMFSSF